MGTLASRLLARLRQADAIRAQVLTYLFLARIYNLVKTSYFNHHLASSCNYHSDHQSATHQKLSLDDRVYHSHGPAQKIQQVVSSRDEWDWRGFPKLWRPFRWHDLTSTVWSIWAAFRTLLLKQLEDLISPASQHLFGMPGNCLLPGRMAIPLAISPLAIVLLTSYHLSWRVWQRLTRRNRLISMVVFLLASERDLERIYARLEANHSRTQAWERMSGMNSITDATNLSNERLFLGSMCYQVYQSNQLCYYYHKLRLNRTRGARAKLVRRVALTSLITIGAFGGLVALFFTYSLITILSQIRYAHVYRACYPPLEQLRARNQLDHSLSSFQLNWHHALSGLIFDTFECIIIWGDSALCITFVPAFAYLLNYDLRLHWSGLEVKLENLLGRVEHQFLVRQVCATREVPSFYDYKPPLQPLYPLHDDNVIDLFNLSCMTLEEPRRLEGDIHEVQFELCDFFNQMERADGVVGDTITMAILIWLSGCAFLSYNHLLYDSKSLTLIVDLVFALGFLVILLATYHLLELRRRCLKSHRVLCSLMAYDQSSCKRGFIKLLEYYSTGRINYHILRAYPYKPTAFITIIGWSFSCFFIAYTLFGPQNRERGALTSISCGDGNGKGD